MHTSRTYICKLYAYEEQHLDRINREELHLALSMSIYLSICVDTWTGSIERSCTSSCWTEVGTLMEIKSVRWSHWQPTRPPSPSNLTVRQPSELHRSSLSSQNLQRRTLSQGEEPAFIDSKRSRTCDMISESARAQCMCNT